MRGFGYYFGMHARTPEDKTGRPETSSFWLNTNNAAPVEGKRPNRALIVRCVLTRNRAGFSLKRSNWEIK